MNANRAEQIRAKAQRLAAQPTASPAAGSEEVSTSVGEEVMTPPRDVRRPAASGAPVRTRPVRLSVDVAPNEHTELVRHSLAAAAELGAVRVHGQEIVRALLRRYLSDPGLQAQVLDDIRAERRAR